MKKTYPNITSRKQFFGGGADSSTQPCGSGVLGPGDRSPSDSSPIPAPRLQSQEVPHLSRLSSTGAANWQRLGDLIRPVAKDDFSGDCGARTGLDVALTGDVVTLTGDDCRESVPRSVPFNIVSYPLCCHPAALWTAFVSTTLLSIVICFCFIYPCYCNKVQLLWEMLACSLFHVPNTQINYNLLQLKEGRN